MKKVLFATENESKVERFKQKLLDHNIKIISINDLNQKIEVIEDGKDAVENALIKARAYASVYNFPVFAMDDNLYIENIPNDLQPGMYVRRVNGKRLNDDEMIKYYSNLAHTYGESGRLTCRWIYGIAVVNNGLEKTYTWSKNDFYIIDRQSDKVNIGYPLNTISVNKILNKYFTDMTEEDKKLVQDDESDVINFLYENV